MIEPALAPPPPPSSTHRVFFGAEGIRAGWSLLLFFTILGTLSALLIVGVRRFSHPQPSTHVRNQMHTRDEPDPPAPEPRKAASPRQVLQPEAAQLGLLLLTTFIMSRIERRPLAGYGLGPVRGGVRHFTAGAFWGMAFLSLLILLLVRTRHLVFEGRVLHGVDVLRIGMIWLLGFLLVGLLEEFLLRGYLQFTLARGLTGIARSLSGGLSPAATQALGFWIAAIFFSILFGLGHRSNAGESPIGLLSAGLAGLVFVFSLWRTGSLLWAIGFHTTWDWAQSFLYGVADSGTLIQGNLYASHPVGRPLMSGGATGPEGSVFILPVLALVAVVIWLTLPGRRTDEPPLG